MSSGVEVEELRDAIYRPLDVVRVYTKLPSKKKADFDRPFTIRRGGTLLDIGIYPLNLAFRFGGPPQEILTTANLGATASSVSFGYLTLALAQGTLVDHWIEFLAGSCAGERRRAGNHKCRCNQELAHRSSPILFVFRRRTKATASASFRGLCAIYRD